MRIVQMEQGTDEWKEWRRTRIGASDIPSIMGVGFKTPYELWREKMGLAVGKTNEAMIRGTMMEPKAREWATRQLKVLIEPVIVESAIYDWAIASLDGLTLDGDILEIKCPGKLDHSLAMKGVVPPKYMPQLLWQMYVAEKSKAFYESFDGDDGIILEVNRDEEEIKKIVAKATEFKQLLDTNTPPELTSRDRISACSNEGMAKSMRAKTLVEKKREIDEELADLKESLLELAGGAGIENDWITISWRDGSSTLDRKAMEEDGIDLSKYLKEGRGSWSLRAK